MDLTPVEAAWRQLRDQERRAVDGLRSLVAVLPPGTAPAARLGAHLVALEGLLARIDALQPPPEPPETFATCPRPGA